MHNTTNPDQHAIKVTLITLAALSSVFLLLILLVYIKNHCITSGSNKHTTIDAVGAIKHNLTSPMPVDRFGSSDWSDSTDESDF